MSVKITKLWLGCSVFLLLSLVPVDADVFSAGQKHMGVTLGSSSGYGGSYMVLGIAANYFVIDNLAVGAEYRGWFGSEPTIHELSVPITYYAPLYLEYAPYGGGFFRRTFIEPNENIDVYGFRVGLSMRLGPNAFSSVGWVQEYYEGIRGNSASNGYPEVSVGVSF